MLDKLKKIFRKKTTVEIRFTMWKNENAEELLERLEKIKKLHPDFVIRAELKDWES